MNAVIVIILSLFIGTGASFKTQLENYLNKNLSEFQGYKYEILQMPDSYKEIELVKSNEFNLSGNLVYVPVKVVKNSGRIIRAIITVKIKIFRNVFVTAKKINRKEKLVLGCFIKKEEDITEIKGTPVYSLNKIDLYRAKMMMKAGDVLTKQDMEEIPIVNVGDEMNAGYINGNVLVTFKVYARQEGVAGQIITVITSDNKLFKGKIVDSKNLKIVE